MKKRNLVFSILFLAVIFLPLLFFGNQDQKSVTREKRNLSASVALPQSVSEINAEFTRGLEAFFSDHIGFRSSLVTLANSVRIKILGVNSVTSKVIEGKDGWLFYNPQGSDGDPMGDYLGTQSYTQQDLERMGDYLQKISDCCKRVGAEFYLIICPNKASVYGERFLPDYFVKGAGPNRADLLVDYLRRTTDIPVTYVKDELIAYSDREYTYFKQDTHWTELGSYLAYRDWYAKYTGELLPPLEDCEKRAAAEPGDLSAQLGIEPESEDYYGVELGRGITYSEADDSGDGGYYHFLSSNRNGKSAVMFRDSFLIYLQPYMCQDFEDTKIYPRQLSTDDFAMLERERPDVVVFEMLERYLP